MKKMQKMYMVLLLLMYYDITLGMIAVSEQLVITWWCFRLLLIVVIDYLMGHVKL